MALDPRYVVAPSLEQYYVDKDTGLPLANGEVTFYKDQARTELKPIYTISGSPPNYTYVQIDNPSTLSAVGTFQDANGNNILPYYFPFDDAGNVELYYITVYSEGDVLQFTREGWPNFSAGGSGESNDSVVNYVPNGQFLLHNNIPATSTTLAGQVTLPTTFIAQGGWSFDRPMASTATDFVLFPRYNSPISNPTGSPRYAVRISTTVTGSGDLFKDLRLKFKDVNKFANSTQTFSFTGQTNTSTDLSLTILLIKNYGTGGSPEDSTVIDTVMIQNSPSIINQVINFGDNIGKVIGPNNDDYLQIVIRLPLSFIFDATFTDFILSPGVVEFTEFPQTTNAQFIYRTSGYMPPPNGDGYDLYLPRIKTLEGEQYDDSQLGQCVFQVRKDPLPGELRCDGSNYLYSGYSAVGIPYKRLGDVLLGTGTYPIFGTGVNFISASISDSLSSVIILSTNAPGTVVPCSAGTSGFTFVIRATGNNYNVTSLNFGNGSLYVEQNVIGLMTGLDIATAAPYLNLSTIRNATGTFQIFYIQFTSISTAIAGTYFAFSTSTNNYYLWFSVQGVGTDPAPPGLTGINVDFTPTSSINQRGNFVAEALGGHQVTTFTALPASSITTGSYFTFSVNPLPQNYYVYYIKDGIIVDPAPGGIGIPVNILSSDNASVVASKTVLAINKFYMTVPDPRGKFIRIWNNGASNDPNAILRGYPYGQGQIIGDVIGSLQLDEIYSHNHNLNVSTQNITGSNLTTNAGNNPTMQSNFISYTGGSESRPINQYLNMFIKY